MDTDTLDSLKPIIEEVKKQEKQSMKPMLIHIGQVLGINMGALIVYLSNVNAVLTTLSILAALIYTCVKIYKEIKTK